MIVVVLGALGLLLGSFVNALAWRLHEGKDWVNDRSECTHCHHKLGALDLIPVLSWMWLRGKCRYCHKKIEDSPFTELALPVLFVASYAWWPQPLHGDGLFMFVLWLGFLVGFLALVVYDFRWFLLPDKLVFPLIGLAAAQWVVLLLFFAASFGDIMGALAGVTILSGTFYVLYIVSRHTWIGGGDITLGVVLGLLAGGALQSVLLLFVASCAGSLFALPQLIAGKGGRKMQVPFGPFLIVGLVIVKLFGPDVIDWYMGLLV